MQNVRPSGGFFLRLNGFGELQKALGTYYSTEC